MTTFHSIKSVAWHDKIGSCFFCLAFWGSIVTMPMKTTSDEPAPATKVREVTVKLFRSAKEVEGVELPPRFNFKDPDFAFYNEQAKVTVVLPNGETKTIEVKSFYFTTHGGIVLTVGLMPMMKVGTYKETRAEIFQELQTLNIKLEDKTREAIERGAPFPRMFLSENTAVRAMIKSDFNNHWFADIAFDVTGDMYKGFTYPGWRQFSECMRKEIDGNISSEKLAPVSIRLRGLVSEAVGIEPKSDVDRFHPYNRFEPGMLTIHSPDGTTNILPVRAIMLGLNGEMVTGIYFIPLMKRVSYKEAIQELYQTLKVLNIEPDEEMKTTMARFWPADQPDSGKGLDSHTLITSGKTFRCVVEVRPHVDGGWFVVIILGTPRDAKSPKPTNNLAPTEQTPVNK